MPQVSIIMPVYNAEAFLEKSVGSVLQQDYSDFELLLIDDGSSDHSGELADTLSKKDQRIRVFHQVNQGPSAARNHGIEEAKGEYLCFIDSDDEIKADYLKKMVPFMKEYDWVCCGIQSVGDQGKSTLSETFDCPNQESIFRQSLSLIERGVINSPVNKLYKTDILKTHHLKLDESMDVGEDYHFNLRVLMECNSFVCIPDQLYLYKIREGSVRSGYKENLVEMRMKNIDLTAQWLKKCGVQSDFVDKMKLKLIFIYLMQLDLAPRKVTKKEIKQTLFQPAFYDLSVSGGISYQMMLLVYKTKNLFLMRCLAKCIAWLKNNHGMRIQGGSI